MSVRALPWRFAGAGKFVSLRAHPVPRVPWLFMLPRDISLFIQGARTDAKIARLQRTRAPAPHLRRFIRNPPIPGRRHRRTIVIRG
jgi:hypothetical protein